MLTEGNRGTGTQYFLKELSVRDTIYSVVNAQMDVDKAILTNAWHRLRTKTILDADKPADEDLS